MVASAFADDNVRGHGFSNGTGGIGSGAEDAPQVSPEQDRAVDRTSGNGLSNSNTFEPEAARPQLKKDSTGSSGPDAEQPAMGESETLAAVAAAEGEPKEAAADERISPSIRPNKAQTPESLGGGTFNQSIELKVPAFRGLEPKLSLKYSSGAGLGSDGLRAGWIGVGWLLDGMPDIVRTAPTNGTPRFDIGDVYQLDGQDMVACGTGVSSPSCSTGGTHVTKVESYQRIKFANNIWTVWSKEGTRSIFKPVSTWGAIVEAGDANPTLIKDSYRWLLAQRVDANGNEVNYSYACRTLPVCYPSKITYSGAEITFVSTVHPAYQTKATGRNLAKLDQQLKRIEIRFGGQQIRAYSLTQETSASTRLQRLKQVREHGSDWTITDGVIGGSALPPTVFTYTDSQVAFVKGAHRVHTPPEDRSAFKGRVVDVAAEFNGDGRADILSVYLPPNNDLSRCQFEITLSTASGFAKPVIEYPYADKTIPCDWRVHGQPFPQMIKFNGHTADLNGDGLSDIMTYQQNRLSIYLTKPQSNGTISFVETFVPHLFQTVDLHSFDENFLVMDLDGDGDHEILPKAMYDDFDNTYYYYETNSFSLRKLSNPEKFYFKSYGGDFDGDGVRDLESRTLVSSSIQITTFALRDNALARKAVYSYPVLNTTVPALSFETMRGPLDFDGDGTTEVLQYSVGLLTGEQSHVHPISIQAFKSSGSNLVAAGSLGNTSFRCATIQPMGPNGMPQIPVFECNNTYGDLDGDGRTEAVFSSAPGGNETGNIMTPCCYTAETPVEVYSDAGGGSWRKRIVPAIGIFALADLNGDGRLDIIRRRSGLTTTSPQHAYIGAPFSSGEVYYSTGPMPDLMSSVKLPTGGGVQIEYKPSSQWGLTAGTLMPFVTQTVSAIVQNDGRGGVSRTEYSYRGGRYDHKERKFLGFAGLTAKLPCASGETACPSVDVTFSQAFAAIGKPTKVVYRDGAGVARKTVVESYAIENTVVPYRALNTATETTITEGSSLVLRKEHSYDAYGNITQTRDFGRKDQPGDETWTLASFAPNTTAYIVSLPRITNVRSVGADGVFSTDTDVYQQHQVFYYDGATDNTVPPTKGNVTIRRSYKFVEPTASYYAEIFTYDPDNGNKLSHVDGAGNRTEWDYDPTYKLHVVRERAPKYFATGGNTADSRFVTTVTPNFVCGEPATKIDWNGITETFTYDAFCRPYGYTSSGTGKYLNTRYESFGSPTAQAVVTYEPLATGTGSLFTRTYYDGLGRSWRVQTSGDTTSGPTRLTDTGYDARGNVAKTSITYFSDDTTGPRWTVNSYDWNDRVVKTVNPDASERIYTYLVQSTPLTGTTNQSVMEMRMQDEDGKVRRSFTDKDNNVILTSGNLSGTWINEARSYDVMGRLVGVRDHSGAVWTYTYDLLGNRLTAVDPDLGTWTYTYDNANRLLTQTDARGAVTTLAYDQMGRLKTKSVKDVGETTATVTATNTYDTDEAGVGTAPFHNVGLLTKSVNAAATHSYSRSLTGAWEILTTRTVIDGVAHVTVERKAAAGLALATSYSPGSVTIGTSADRWVYNLANKLVTVPGYITAATYEADGQTKSITYANGVTTDFTYSPERRWLTRVTTKKGTTVLLDNQYTLRDKVGRIMTINGLTTSDDWTYVYDDLGRLTSAQNAGNNTLDETYTYSATGNLLSRTKIGTYTYPAGTAVRPHAATKIGAKTIGYDDNGNMLTDGTRTLVWDRSNLLQSVTQGASAVTFSYGPDGARAIKNWATGKTLYANANVEIDRTTPGSEVYTRYPHPDLKVVTTSAGTTTKSFLHRDHLSSVRLVTNEAGTAVEQTNYAAYGEPTNKAMQTEKGYIGERFDPETGLMYLNARYYEPTFGRFIPPDEESEDEKEFPIMSPAAGDMIMNSGPPSLH